MKLFQAIAILGVWIVLFEGSVLNASAVGSGTRDNLKLDWVFLPKVGNCNPYDPDECSYEDDTKTFVTDGIKYVVSTHLKNTPLKLEITAIDTVTNKQLFSEDIYKAFPGSCVEQVNETYASVDAEEWPVIAARGRIAYLSCGKVKKSIVVIKLDSNQVQVAHMSQDPLPKCGNYVIPTSQALTTHGEFDPYPNYYDGSDWIQFDPTSGQVLRQFPCITADKLILKGNPKSIGQYFYIWSPSNVFPWGNTSGIDPITMLRTWTQPENIEIKWVNQQTDSETATVLAEHRYFNSSNQTIFRSLNMNFKTGVINWNLDGFYFSKKDFLGSEAFGIDLFRVTYPNLSPFRPAEFMLVRGFNSTNGKYDWKTKLPFYGPTIPGLNCGTSRDNVSGYPPFYCSKEADPETDKVFKLSNVEVSSNLIKFRIVTTGNSWQSYPKKCVLDYTVDNITGALIKVDDPLDCLNKGDR